MEYAVAMLAEETPLSMNGLGYRRRKFSEKGRYSHFSYHRAYN